MADFDFGRGREGGRASADNQSLLSYFRILRERVWLIVACTVLALGGAIAYVETAPRKYQAQAELEVQASSPGDVVLATLPVLHQTGDPTAVVLTGASLVTTPRVAAAAATALGIKSPDALLRDVTSTPIGGASLVAVQATASSPLLAQRTANAFVDQTIAVATQTMHAAISSELPTLKQQLLAVPRAQRYGPGSIGATIEELQQLQLRSDPTLVNAATASLPVSPSSPKTKLTLVAGLFAGLLLGFAAAFGFHAVDPRLRREEQIRELFDLPILARIARERPRRRTGPRRRRPRRTGPLVPSELKTSSEGFRTLRATLTARGLSSEPRTYLVTGSVPSEGKSTTAINLAVALAQGGASLILIEADFRKPTFAGAFNLKPFHGIEQVLVDEVDLSDALVPVTFKDTTISVLAAHGSGAEFADRLTFAAVRKLVQEAGALAEFVVIDSPPLTAVIDALPFAQIADEVLIVTRLDYSRLNKLADLEELLRENGVSASGIVLLGTDSRAQQYYRGTEPTGIRPRAQTKLPST